MSMSEHYDSVADGYEQAFFYASPEYREWVLSMLIDEVKLTEGFAPADLRVCDLGGGTGNFTQALAERLGVDKITCVDAFQPMLQQAMRHPRVEPLLMDAVDFTQTDLSYSHLIMKELVHHIPVGLLGKLYRGVAAQLVPEGAVVVITRPQEVQFPLFARARQVWRDGQPASSVITDAMSAAGLSATTSEHDFEALLPKATWYGMIRARFWSTFSHFTDAELESGILELEETHQAQTKLYFVDRLLFIVGRKQNVTQSKT